MKLLELFSGTGSVGKVAKDFGFEVVSLDLKGALINTDILDWNYRDYPVGYFDFIHASPPCVEYSIAKTTGVRKIIEANRIVKKTLEIIDYLKPKYWTIENPQTGLLKKQEFMEGLPYFDIDYCKYGFNYRKRTRIWTNIKCWTPRPLCKKDCGKVVDNKHIETAQRLPNDLKNNPNGLKHTQEELYKIPEELVRETFQSLNQQ